MDVLFICSFILNLEVDEKKNFSRNKELAKGNRTKAVKLVNYSTLSNTSD